MRIALYLICCTMAAPAMAQTNPKSTLTLRARVEASPTLPLHAVPLAAHPPTPNWQSGAVSSVAVVPNGNIYEIQRGDKAPPILFLDRTGKILGSWGTGDFTIPHTIRIDPAGDVWTVDAASSKIIKYSRSGKKLLTMALGEQPNNGSPFNGATDIAFAPNGDVFITDGYGNARVLEYSPNGKRLRQWGHRGTAPGEFNLPHSIQIDRDGTIYVADRENGRIQEFTLNGAFLREISHLGRIYSIKLSGDTIWATMEPFNQDPGNGDGWLVQLDRQTGKILGHLDIPDARAGHSLDLNPCGDPILTSGTQVLIFKK